ncbi:MAG: efflux RND transporter periplasmic adaptor subunit [Gammaproteobacteria bacterium]|nr:efflux RND transporter periplasmic adaptor subunit [Gammaproteobacteria bacterium]
MKNKISIITVAALMTLSLAGCSEKSDMENKNSGQISKNETALEHAEKHLDSKYVCPMHPQIIKDQEGSCPICGMTLVKVDIDEPVARQKEKKILYWVAPMDPNYQRDKPGKSPMGMDLVPVYDETATDAENDNVKGEGPVVKISPNVIQNLGVRTAVVTKGQLAREIDTVGYVDFDEGKLRHVHMRTEGWIESLRVKSEGERVKKDDVLFKIYSPTLVNAQEEYLQSLNIGNRQLVQASFDRLLALGLTGKQIDSIKKNRKVFQKLDIYAEQDGVIANLNVREGMYVTPMNEVMSIADLSSVWLLAEIFEQQVDWVNSGDTAEVNLSYAPGMKWTGRVEYIYPSLDPKTRTLTVRLIFDNPEEILKPNMYANVRLYGAVKEAVLYLPKEAIIRTAQEQRVITSDGKGRFKTQTVTTGMESGDSIEIISGLNEGEQVVVSGQFLIDSEASLKASLMRMTESAQAKNKISE